MASRSLITILGAAHAISHSFLNALPPLVPLLIATTGASQGQIGQVGALAYLLYGAGSLVGGMLTSRFGAGMVVSLSLLMSGASIWIMPLLEGLESLAVGLGLCAAFGSLYHPSVNTLISTKYQHNVATVFGIHGMGGNIGQVAIPTASVLLATVFGWKSPFLVLAIFSILLGGLLMQYREKPREETQTKGFGSALQSPGLKWLLIFLVLAAMSFQGIELFLAQFLVSERGFTMVEAGMMTSSVLLCGVLGQLAGGRACDRLGGKKVLYVFTPMIPLAILLLVLLPSNLPFLLLFVAVYGSARYGIQPAFDSLTRGLTLPETRGQVFGVSFFVGFSTGALSAALVGFLADQITLKWAVGLMAIFPVLAVAALSKIVDVNKRE